MHKFPYNWMIKKANFTKDKGKVFSCFACGGGSSFGYKLAGFDVIGCNEIDPKMMDAYIANHNPKYSYLEPIQTFKLRKDLPQELYELDILDGSPPCSSFSSLGNRDKDWGKKKKFREGQASQILDNLFFDFIDLAKRLQPKVVIAENVKGLLMGNAMQYVRRIYQAFDQAGYYCQHWLLDASKMGVPQRRKRVFFVALRKDLARPFLYHKDLFTKVPLLELKFNEAAICYGIIKKDIGIIASDLYYSRWKCREKTDTCFGDINERLNGKGSCFSDVFAKDELPLPTITSKGGIYDFESGHFISNNSFILGSTFPTDYNFQKNKIYYIVGMSVPPVVMANISEQIYLQWLQYLK